ncbi:hypothetical protein CYMTET_10573 [Cymbomonas tetramitiformis]|uniref:Uncharacterized protein n=1 Tax=Cymbomonas tetramitiformis TaxID=36881 RepID=A0AAE0LE13_9CHLO|nr:hypothetical protein CYMTET_10573 [Cymbomonas tetramitiformis]
MAGTQQITAVSSSLTVWEERETALRLVREVKEQREQLKKRLREKEETREENVVSKNTSPNVFDSGLALLKSPSVRQERETAEQLVKSIKKHRDTITEELREKTILCEELDQHKDRLFSELQDTSERCGTLENEVERLTAELAEKNALYSRARENEVNTAHEVERMQTNLEKEQRNSNRLREELSRFHSHMEEERTSSGTATDRLRADLSRYQEECKVMRENVESWKKVVQDSTGETERLRRMLDNERQTSSSAVRNSEALEVQLEGYKLQNDELRVQLEKQDISAIEQLAAARRLEENQSQDASKVHELQGQISKLRQDGSKTSAELLGKVEEQRKQLATAQEDLSVLRKKLSEKSEEFAQTETKLSRALKFEQEELRNARKRSEEIDKQTKLDLEQAAMSLENFKIQGKQHSRIAEEKSVLVAQLQKEVEQLQKEKMHLEERFTWELAEEKNSKRSVECDATNLRAQFALRLTDAEKVEKDLRNDVLREKEIFSALKRQMENDRMEATKAEHRLRAALDEERSRVVDSHQEIADLNSKVKFLEAKQVITVDEAENLNRELNLVKAKLCRPSLNPNVPVPKRIVRSGVSNLRKTWMPIGGEEIIHQQVEHFID